VAKEAVAQGYRAVKTNPVFFDQEKPYFFSGGFRIAPGFPGPLDQRPHLNALVDQMTAYREADRPRRRPDAGPELQPAHRRLPAHRAPAGAPEPRVARDWT
jgi:hypothetical protein